MPKVKSSNGQASSGASSNWPVTVPVVSSIQGQVWHELQLIFPSLNVEDQTRVISLFAIAHHHSLHHPCRNTKLYRPFLINIVSYLLGYTEGQPTYVTKQAEKIIAIYHPNSIGFHKCQSKTF